MHTGPIPTSATEVKIIKIIKHLGNTLEVYLEMGGITSCGIHSVQCYLRHIRTPWSFLSRVPTGLLSVQVRENLYRIV